MKPLPHQEKYAHGEYEYIKQKLVSLHNFAIID
jgi:hypothetical protein